MHMSDALVAPAVAVIMYACSTIAMGHSVTRKISFLYLLFIYAGIVFWHY